MSDNPRPKLKASSLKRITPDTKFYIDYDWWEKSNLDLKTYLYSRLNIEQDLNLSSEMEEIDLVNPETGEVRRVDGFQFVMQTYFSQLPDDFMTRTSLVDAVFYILLANANEPMTAREIAEKTSRSPEVILKTVGGSRVYQGIRPLLESEGD